MLNANSVEQEVSFDQHGAVVGMGCGLAVGALYYGATAVAVGLASVILFKAVVPAYAAGKIAAGTVCLIGGVVTGHSAIKRSSLFGSCVSASMSAFNMAREGK